MSIYLVRHGTAESETVHPKRPLTLHGRDIIDKTGHYLKKKVSDIEIVYHSPKLRSIETASILASYWKPEQGICLHEGLEPEDDPGQAVELCNQQDNIVIVGHLPHLPALLSLLLINKNAAPFIDFACGAVVCLDKVSVRRWAIRWLFSPELL